MQGLSIESARQSHANAAAPRLHTRGERHIQTVLPAEEVEKEAMFEESGIHSLGESAVSEHHMVEVMRYHLFSFPNDGF
jgi:hypothetical protein